MLSFRSSYFYRWLKFVVLFGAIILLFAVSLKPEQAIAYEDSSIDVRNYVEDEDFHYYLDPYTSNMRTRRNSNTYSNCGNYTLTANSTNIYFHVIGIRNNQEAWKNKWRYAVSNPSSEYLAKLEYLQYSSILAIATTGEDSWRDYFFYDDTSANSQGYNGSPYYQNNPVTGWYFVPQGEYGTGVIPYVASTTVSQIDDSVGSPTYGQYFGAPNYYEMAYPEFDYESFSYAYLYTPSYTFNLSGNFLNPGSSFQNDMPTLWIGEDSSKIYFDILYTEDYTFWEQTPWRNTYKDTYSGQLNRIEKNTETIITIGDSIMNMIRSLSSQITNLNFDLGFGSYGEGTTDLSNSDLSDYVSQRDYFYLLTSHEPFYFFKTFPEMITRSDSTTSFVITLPIPKGNGSTNVSFDFGIILNESSLYWYIREGLGWLLGLSILIAITNISIKLVTGGDS